jgi:hypothetical protein
MSAKKKYEILLKKHKSLPKWAWLTSNFKTKDEDPMLETVRNSISDKIESVCKGILEPIISGQENYCCWFERKMLNDKDGEKMFEIYKAFQSLLWESNKISLSTKEKDYIKWIISTKKSWEKHVPVLEKLCDKLSIGWANYKKKEDTTAYHG